MVWDGLGVLGRMTTRLSKRCPQRMLLARADVPARSTRGGCVRPHKLRWVPLAAVGLLSEQLEKKSLCDWLTECSTRWCRACS